jgi:drug/metabolite transporter (DMT)-like permease
MFTPPSAATQGWPFPPLGIDVDPVLLSAARATLAFMMLAGYLAVSRRRTLRISARDLPFLAFFGVFGLALVHATYFMAISLTNVATAILLEYLAPVIVLVVSVAFMRERLTLALPISVALSVAGCALMVGAFSGSLVVSPAGLAWGLASAVAFAGYTLMGRWASTRYSSWTLLAYGLGFATLFWFAYLGGPGPVLRLLADWRALAAVSFVAFVSTVVPFGAFLKALRHIEATKASVTATLEPVIAGIAAWWAFSEKLAAAQLLGGALVIVGVVLSQLPGRNASEVPPAT